MLTDREQNSEEHRVGTDRYIKSQPTVKLSQ